MTNGESSGGRRVLTDVGLLVALLGVVASAAANWFFSGLVFFGESLDRDDYRSMSLGFALAAGLLLLGLLPVWALRASAWVGVAAVVLALVCGVAALSARGSMAGAPATEYPEPWAALQTMAWVPTTWPLALLVLLSPWLRGRSSPRPR